MWIKPLQVERLKLPRVAAASAVRGSGGVLPDQEVRLKLCVYCSSRAGDLDSFITGICDGLMTAHRSSPIDASLWEELPEDARPDQPIMFADDSLVCKIEAERRQPDSSGIRYELIVDIK
jgi:hypothetical protein